MAWIFDPRTVAAPFYASVTHGRTLWAAPPARTDRAEADPTKYLRPERRIDAVDTNRPDYDAVPEHDPDGTPWAA